jgi:glucose uptake protein GlcU
MTTFYSIWAIAVIFAFLGFITFAQQGKPGKNTFWYNHKAIIGIICVLIVAASLAFLKFG